MDAELTRVELYTDGACSGNPGPGGWAFVLKDMTSGTVAEGSGGEVKTTNNRMELMGVIEGLRTLKQRSRVELYSDSQYVIKGLAEWMDGWKKKGWKRGKNAPVKNIEMWKELDELRGKHEISYHWVRGHDGHPENERCDVLAVEAAIRFGGTQFTADELRNRGGPWKKPGGEGVFEGW